MSIKAMAWVWDHSLSAGIDRLVLLSIADAANDEGKNAWPAHETLAKKTRLHHRTIERSLFRLRGTPLKELDWDIRDGRTNVYRLTKMAFTEKQLKAALPPPLAPGVTPGAAPGVTPGAAPSTPPLSAVPPPRSAPSDPYVPVNNHVHVQGQSAPPTTSAVADIPAGEDYGELIAAAHGADYHQAVIRRVAWERLEAHIRDRSAGVIGTGTLTSFIETMTGELHSLNIEASPEAIVRACSAMWKAHWAKEHPD